MQSYAPENPVNLANQLLKQERLNDFRAEIFKARFINMCEEILIQFNKGFEKLLDTDKLVKQINQLMEQSKILDNNLLEFSKQKVAGVDEKNFANNVTTHRAQLALTSGQLKPTAVTGNKLNLFDFTFFQLLSNFETVIPLFFSVQIEDRTRVLNSVVNILVKDKKDVSKVAIFLNMMLGGVYEKIKHALPGKVKVNIIDLQHVVEQLDNVLGEKEKVFKTEITKLSELEKKLKKLMVDADTDAKQASGEALLAVITDKAKSPKSRLDDAKIYLTGIFAAAKKESPKPSVKEAGSFLSKLNVFAETEAASASAAATPKRTPKPTSSLVTATAHPSASIN